MRKFIKLLIALLVIFTMSHNAIYSQSTTPKVIQGNVNIKGELDAEGNISFNNAALYSDNIIILSDTLKLVFQAGNSNAGDAAIFDVGSIIASMQWENYLMFNITKVKVVLAGTSPDIDIQLYKDANMDDPYPTSILSSDLTCTSTTTGNSTTSFASNTISNTEQFWVEVTEATSAPTFCNITIYGYYSRGSDVPTTSWPGPAEPDLENLVTIYVTDTTDSGTAGSLRYAMEYAGPRRIIPTISGTISLTEEISITNPHMYYDGAAGPSPGLLVIQGAIWIQTTDIVITYLHVRLGDVYYGAGNNCISILHGSHDIVIDHCSLLWGVDQIIGTNPYFGGPGTVADLSRITITNNIISQGLSYVEGPEPEHSKGPLIYYESDSVLVMNNLMVQNRDRNPLFEGGATGQIINNMCYWGYQPMSLCFQTNPITSEACHHHVDIIGNKSSGYRERWQIRFYDFDYNNSQIYMTGNNGPNDDWDTDSIWGNPYEASVRIYTPNFDYGVTIRSADEAQTYVLANAGAFPNDRCKTDSVVVSYYETKPFGLEFYSLGEGNEHLVDSPDDLEFGWDLFPFYEP